ncbi:YiiX family permuted papain-like enzyme [Flavobacterium sp. '19STA2R22 D10 B1']|uniref:YiiX family permuted papain-like enzyme n=1 Tax=Flavobacterium aerium TaxID=3037261 RepID=UPI00278C8F3D|nr:YiiX family permuted papain-like enzyme [Flavobacterium sp. '19STA2R22 D10 B1']
MKKTFSVIATVLLISTLGICFDRGFYGDNATNKIFVQKNKIQNGDLIFQISLSPQSKAIQLATQSKYSHCGIVYKNGDQYVVFEAVQPIKSTPLEQWIAKGKNRHYVVKRLKNSEEILTDSALEKMKIVGAEFKGKNYDSFFEWSDDKIYCSELIWKIYQRAVGIEIGEIQQLKDFDLSNPAVKQKLKERYGATIPLNEKVISPASIFNSNALITVLEK